MSFTRWLLCHIGQHSGDISCDIDARTVTYQCRYCDYSETDAIAASVLQEMGIEP